jgi:hypothetical protein
MVELEPSTFDKISPAARSTKKLRDEIFDSAPVHELQSCPPKDTCGQAVVSKMASMITSTAWVPRGFAAPFPTKYNFDEEEFERIANLAKLQLDDAKEDLEEAQENEAKQGKASKKEGKEEASGEDDDNDASEFVPTTHHGP